MVLNYVALVSFAALTTYASWFVAIDGPLRVTELDRAGVFNEDKLKEFDKDNGTHLAANLRHNAGQWITRPALTTAVHCGYAGIAMSICNVVLLHFARSRTRDPRPNPYAGT
ncbi:MAG TPA: hypothetical protein VM487_25465 [Phycisphaerae bacterium]|nr:hypothetical protein [Phycisphaerae bacterium]